MGLNDVASGERVHIGFFGRRNAGKSSLVNAVTGQALSVVSDVRGTTTDPVKKAMELLPLGPVVFIDTPGLEDDSELGKLREQRTRERIMIRMRGLLLRLDLQKKIPIYVPLSWPTCLLLSKSQVMLNLNQGFSTSA